MEGESALGPAGLTRALGWRLPRRRLHVDSIRWPFGLKLLSSSRCSAVSGGFWAVWVDLSG